MAVAWISGRPRVLTIPEGGQVVLEQGGQWTVTFSDGFAIAKCTGGGNKVQIYSGLNYGSPLLEIDVPTDGSVAFSDRLLFLQHN